MELPENAPKPRFCHIVQWPHFDGFGFNLHGDKTRPGQYIGKIDDGSPAEVSGLKEGDRIIEVNGINVLNENHKQVVQRIKTVANETRLLVIDQEGDKWYKDRDMVIRGDQDNIIFGTSKPDTNGTPAMAPVESPKQNGDDNHSVSSHNSSVCEKQIEEAESQVTEFGMAPVEVTPDDHSISSVSSDEENESLPPPVNYKEQVDGPLSKSSGDTEPDFENKSKEEQPVSAESSEELPEAVKVNEESLTSAESSEEPPAYTESSEEPSVNLDEELEEKEPPVNSPVEEPDQPKLVESHQKSSEISDEETSQRSRSPSADAQSVSSSASAPTSTNAETESVEDKSPTPRSPSPPRSESDRHSYTSNHSSSNGSTTHTTTGLSYDMSAAEMRAHLAAKKKFDPRKDAIDLKKKHQIIQNM